MCACVLSVALGSTDEAWWSELEEAERGALADYFEEAWFASLSVSMQASYGRVASLLEAFARSEADSNEHDSYVGFAPLLFRASFHSSGTFDLSTGTAGSNGGTIFHPAELEDGENSCIDVATAALEEVAGQVTAVSKADKAVIAGVVALNVLEFPRMDLLRVRGGRHDYEDIAYRGRLPSADDDPEAKFVDQLGFDAEELVALIGGGHEVGSAHGLCSGYIGSWTTTPLSWTPATFFPDLFRDDWRWYEICSYTNETAYWRSVPDPFADGAAHEEEEEEDASDLLACPIAMSRKALICEEQAVAGCDFDDGLYPVGSQPCEGDLLMRLKSDFFLRENPVLEPHARAFAQDEDLLAATFGEAYHTLTHYGLDRCGMSGHGCAAGTTCAETRDSTGTLLYESCVPEDDDDNHNRLWYNLSSAESAGVLALLLALALILVAALCLAKQRSPYAFAAVTKPGVDVDDNLSKVKHDSAEELKVAA